MEGSRGRLGFRPPALLWLPAVVGLMGLVIALCSATWIGRPFPGFKTMPFGIVSSGGLKDWTGTVAGLAPDDRILAVAGRLPAPGDSARAQVLDRPAEARVTYLVRRGDEEVSRTIPVQTFRWTDYALTVAPFMLAGWLFLLLGAVPVWLKPHERAARVHLAWATSVAAYFFLNMDIDTSQRFVGGYFLSMLVVAATTFHLALVFPREVGAFRRWPRLAWPAYGLLVPAGAVLSAAYLLALGGLLDLPVSLFVTSNQALVAIGALAVLGFLVTLAVKTWRTDSPLGRRQGWVVLAGFMAAFLPQVLLWGLPYLSGAADPSGFWFNATTLAFACFPASIAFAIVRYGLFDITLIIKRTLTYAVSAGAVVLGYVGVTGGLKAGFLAIGQPNDMPSQIVATVLVALAFAPIRDRTRALLDRLFDRSDYDFQAIVTRFGAITRTTVDAEALLAAFAATIEEALRPRGIAIHLADDAGAIFARGEVEEDPADVDLPLMAGETTLGTARIGGRRSDQAYQERDLALLQNLTQALALALSNAQLFKQLAGQERLKRDLEIAADVQMGFLPTNISIPKGALISVSCTPASEVGGDFYDFVQIDATRWGIIVGDVAGKGVPAALMMAASLIIFRTVAAGIPSPAAVLARMNKLVHRNRPSKKTFVTAVYMVYDARTGAVRIANAGQPKPLLNGEPVEIKGLPLGVNTRATYREVEVRLRPFDTLVAYSDGLEDIENEAGEQWGPARVERFFRAAMREQPSDARQALMAGLKAFAGLAPAADDLTLAILQRRPDTFPFAVQARTGPLVMLESHATASLE